MHEHQSLSNVTAVTTAEQEVLPVAPPPPQLKLMLDNNDDKRNIQYESEVRGHSGAIYCCDISCDCQFLATGSFDKSIIVWDAAFPHKMICCLQGHSQLVSDLSWAVTSSSCK